MTGGAAISKLPLAYVLIRTYNKANGRAKGPPNPEERMIEMQKNVNLATSFNPANVRNLRFSALMVEEYGGIGEYWCKAESLEEAKAEAVEAANQYMGSVFGEGDKIVSISLGEKMPSGETVSRGSIEL